MEALVATRHSKPICYNLWSNQMSTNDVATRHSKPICYNISGEMLPQYAVATRHSKPICYNQYKYHNIY